MSAEFEIIAEQREQLGKSASRRARALANKVPAVIYGANQTNLHIEIDANQLTRKLQNEAFYSHILNLKLGSQSHKVVLKALQRHPYKQRVLHVDFLKVSETEKLTMQVPLHFVGESTAPGAKKGGLVSHLMNTVEITCLPSDLPEFIEVSLSNLDMDESIHLSQIKLPKGIQLIELLHNNDAAVVSIHMPRVAAEISSEAPIAVETQVIKEKKKED